MHRDWELFPLIKYIIIHYNESFQDAGYLCLKVVLQTLKKQGCSQEHGPPTLKCVRQIGKQTNDREVIHMLI